MEEDKIILERASFEFSQDGNCTSGADSSEFLTIDCEADIGIDRIGDCFYVLKTEGWSINSTSDLDKLFNRINGAIKIK